MPARDYYDILGVSRNASPDEIRTAHRTLVKKWHPDRNKSNSQAATRFSEIQSAYDVLSDPDKRKKYDQWGHDFEKIDAAEKQGYGPFSPGSGGGGARPRPGGGASGGSGWSGGVDFSDLFGSMFGGGGGGAGGAGGRKARQPQPSPYEADDEEDLDVVRQVTVPFRRAMKGTRLSLEVGESGQKETIEVSIPAGIANGQRIRVKGKGNQGGPRSKVRGDLYLAINVADDPVFERSGNDLIVQVSVDLYTALLGGNISVSTLDDSITLNIPPGTSSGQKLRAAGKGITPAAAAVPGDLYAVVKIALPRHLNDEAKSLVERLRIMAPVSDR